MHIRHETLRPMAERSYPAMQVEIECSRKVMYYFFNVVMPMALFVFVSFGDHALGVAEHVADRMNFSLVTLLTAAAYKLAVAQLVPPVSYLTRLDTYVLTCILIVALECIMLPIAYGFGESANQVEGATFYVAISAFIWLNVSFFRAFFRSRQGIAAWRSWTTMGLAKPDMPYAGL